MKKIIFVFALFFLGFFFHEELIEKGIEIALPKITKEKFTFESKEWKEGRLVFHKAKLGPFFYTEDLGFEFSFLKNFYFEMGLSLHSPKIVVDLSCDTPLLHPALLIPKKFWGIKLNVTQGEIEIIGERHTDTYQWTFQAGFPKEEIGLLQMYSSTPLLSCKTTLSGKDLLLEGSLSCIPTENLILFLSLFNPEIGNMYTFSKGEIQGEGKFFLKQDFSLESAQVSFCTEELGFEKRDFEIKEASLKGTLSYSSQEGSSLHLEIAKSSLGWQGNILAQVEGNLCMKEDLFEPSFLNVHFLKLPLNFLVEGSLSKCYLSSDWIDIELSSFEKAAFHVKKMSEAPITSLLERYQFPFHFEGELDIQGEFTADKIWAEFGTQKLKLIDNSFEIEMGEQKAFLTHFFTTHQTEFLAPFSELTLRTEIGCCNQLSGLFGWKEDGFFVDDVEGNFENIFFGARAILRGVDFFCFDHVKTKEIDPLPYLHLIIDKIEGEIQDLRKWFPDIPPSLQGRFRNGKDQCQLFGHHVAMEWTATLLFEDISYLPWEGNKLENVEFIFRADSSQKEWAISDLKGDFISQAQKKYYIYSKSIQGVLESCQTCEFDIALSEGKNSPLIDLFGTLKTNRSQDLFISIQGNYFSIPISEFSLSLNKRRELKTATFSSSFETKDLFQEMTFLKEIGMVPLEENLFQPLASLQGEVEANIRLLENQDLLIDLQAKELQFLEEKIDHFSLAAKKRNFLWSVEHLKIGEAELKGDFLFHQQQLESPQFQLQWKSYLIKGKGTYKNGIATFCVSEIEGDFPKGYTLKSDSFMTLKWGPIIELKNIHLSLQDNNIKIASLAYNRTSQIWEASQVEAFQLYWKKILGQKEASFFSWQGATQFKEIPFYTTFQCGQKYHSLFLQDKEDVLELLFSKDFECDKIEGQFLGLKASLLRKDKNEYEGALKILDGNKAGILQGVDFLKKISNLELQGQFHLEASRPSFKGELVGEEFSFQGVSVTSFRAKADINSKSLTLTDVIISDLAGTLNVKQFKCFESPFSHKWLLEIPIAKGQNIKPSLIRTSKEEAKENPFIIRSFVFTKLSMELGKWDSLVGEGLLNFTNGMKKESSFLDIPLDILKDIGLDPGLFTPVCGEVQGQLREGRLYFTEIKNTFSEGKRSEFLLTFEKEPSFLDLEGNLAIYLQIKQQVLLKMAEPFILSISGTVKKPKYEILKRPLHNSGYSKKMDHFDSISNLREPAYAGRPIGGDRKSKDYEMNIFNGCPELCRGLLKK